MSKLENCKICGEEIASNAKACPKCGAKVKKPFYKKWWVWVIVVIIMVAIGTSGGSDSTNNNNEKQSIPTVAQKYEIVGDVQFTKDGFGSVYIEGTIKNKSGSEASYLQIIYNLYDKDGNQVGTAMDNINNLEKDGTWKFKAIGFDTDNVVTQYKLSEITGW